MSSNIINKAPFLRTSREYPEDNVNKLATSLSKTYIDIAGAVNERTIGIYPVNKPAITGNNYFFTTKKQQTLRQVYPVLPADITTGSIKLGFKLAKIFQIAQVYGTYNGNIAGIASVFGFIFGSNVAIAGQISFFITTDNTSTTSDLITFVIGAGSPTLIKGQIVVEWISQTDV